MNEDTANALLGAKIDAAIAPYSDHMGTKQEIIDYFRSESPRNWREKFTDAMRGVTGQSKNTVSRQVQGDRADKAPRTNAVKEAYRKLGESLPPTRKKLPPGGITIRVKGTVNPSPKRRKGGRGGEKPRERTFDLHYDSDSRGMDLINDPDLASVLSDYNLDGAAFVDMLGADTTISII